MRLLIVSWPRRKIRRLWWSSSTIHRKAGRSTNELSESGPILSKLHSSFLSLTIWVFFWCRFWSWEVSPKIGYARSLSTRLDLFYDSVSPSSGKNLVNKRYKCWMLRINGLTHLQYREHWWSSKNNYLHLSTLVPIRKLLAGSLGDQFARWTSKSASRITTLPHGDITDGIFKSTVHRAINRSGVRRYSIPLFFGADYNVRLDVSHKYPLAIGFRWCPFQSRSRDVFLPNVHSNTRSWQPVNMLNRACRQPIVIIEEYLCYRALLLSSDFKTLNYVYQDIYQVVVT